MKKSILFSLLVALLMWSCSSDDDSLGAITVRPNISINIDAIVALPPFTDITDFVNFGQPLGQSAADFVSEVSVGDDFVLDRPQGLQSSDAFLYYFTVFEVDGQEVEVDGNIVGGKLELILPEGVTGVTVDEYYDVSENNGVPAAAWRVIDAEDTTDTEWKYTLEVYIERAEDVFGPFTIDPKIRIKSRN